MAVGSSEEDNAKLVKVVRRIRDSLTVVRMHMKRASAWFAH